MRFIAFLVVAAAAVLVGCGSDSDSTATPTEPAGGGATATPGGGGSGNGGGGNVGSGGLTPASGDASFIAVIDLATGQATTRFESGDVWNAWFEDGGEAVNALVLREGAQPRTVRFGLDGSVLTDSAAELQLRLNADGTARAFGGPIDETFFRTFLEVDGELVELDGDPTVLPVGFSPQGDRLLSYTAIPPAAEGEAAISYTVHSLDGSVQTTFVNRLSATDPAGSQVAWSPSGRYVAASGLDGLTAYDTESGEAIVLGASGSTEWSPSEDALLLFASANELQVVRLPDLERVSIEVDTNGVAASFDPTGQVVTVNNRARGITTIFDAVTGEELLALTGLGEEMNVIGFEPVIMTDDGLAVALEGAQTCEGVMVIHPGLGVRGQCLIGATPRWAPDASALAFTRGSEVIVFDIEALTELVVASEVPETEGGTLARWNDGGTHLLLEWPWGGGGWTDSLP